MYCMRLFAVILFIDLATAHRPAVDGISVHRPSKFTGEYTQQLHALALLIVDVQLLQRILARRCSYRVLISCCR